MSGSVPLGRVNGIWSLLRREPLLYRDVNYTICETSNLTLCLSREYYHRIDLVACELEHGHQMAVLDENGSILYAYQMKLCTSLE